MIINHYKCATLCSYMHSLTVINRVICSFLDYELIQSLSLTFLIKEWFTLFLFSVLSWFFPFFLAIGVFELMQDSNQITSLLYTCFFFHPRQLGQKNVCWPERLIEFYGDAIVFLVKPILSGKWMNLVSDATTAYRAYSSNSINSDWPRRQLRSHIGTQ